MALEMKAIEGGNMEGMNEHVRAAVQFLKALSHETRLMILCLLDPFMFIRNHLMAQISPLSKARSEGRYSISAKLRNAADGLIWATGGRISAHSGRRYAPLVASQAKAESMPSQNARKSGQMIPYKHERV